MSQALGKRVVSLEHEGHQGVVKTKERLRTKVWWPGMDRDAEKLCAECYGCQLVTKHVPPLPVKPRATTSKIIIQRLDAQFARYGIPKSLRTDNSPNLVSNEIEDYLKEMGVEHRHTTPLWPRANGEVERQNTTLLNAIRAAHKEGKNWRVKN